MVWWCYGSCCCPLPPAPSIDGICLLLHLMVYFSFDCWTSVTGGSTSARTSGAPPTSALHRERRQRHWDDHQAAGAQQLRRPILRHVLHQAQPGLHQDGEEQVLAGQQATGRLSGGPQVHNSCRCVGARRLPEPGLHHLRSSDTETRYQHSAVQDPLHCNPQKNPASCSFD